MLDDMFPFIDPIMETGTDDMFHFVAMLEEYFQLIEESGGDPIASLPVRLPEKTQMEFPLDITLSLLKPHELEKLKKYVMAYLVKYHEGEAQ